MALIKQADHVTNYVLPVVMKIGEKEIKRNRYYESEYMLFKAYRQLKSINCVLKPLYPVVYKEEVVVYD